LWIINNKHGSRGAEHTAGGALIFEAGWSANATCKPVQWLSC